MAIQYRVRKLMFENRQVRTQPVSFLVFQEWFADLLSNINIGFDVVLYDRYTKRLEEFKQMPFELSNITRLLQMEPYANNNVGYFLERGWTIEEAEQKVTERQSSNSLDAIIKKKKVSKEEALKILKERKQKTANTIIGRYGEELHDRRSKTLKQNKQKYLTQISIERGIPYNEAVSEIAKERSIKGQKVPRTTNTQLQYYLNQGLSVVEAKIALTDRQRTFSLTRCIEQYGDTIGLERWRERQTKWMQTMDLKTDEEKKRILEAKIQNSRFVSTASRRFFAKIISQLPADLEIYEGDCEYFINANGKFWKYDFTIPSLNLIVEFNGTHVHPKPSAPDNWVHVFTKQSKDVVLEHDRCKIQAAKDKGFDVLVVWSDESLDDQVEKIVELINTLYEKKKMIISVNDKLNELKLWYTNDQLADHLGISKSSLEKITPNVTPSDNISSKIEAFFEQHCLRNQTMVNVAQLHEFADQHQSVLMVSTPDGYQPILQIFHKLPRTIYELGTPDFKIRCSEDHLVETVDGWVLANSVQIGQPVVTKHGLQPITIKDKQGCEKVYDFEVGHDNHRYWSNGISSHNSGKSFVACNMMREAQQEKNAFVLAVDSENAIDDDFVSKIGVDVSEENYMYVSVITIAHVKKVVSEFINRYRDTGETRPVMIVIDSLGMLLTETEFKHLEEGETKGDQGQRAKQMKSLLRGFVQSIKKLNIQIIITDQVYAANQDAILAGLNDGLWVVNGAVKYSLSNVLLLTKLRLKEGSSVTGINMKVEAIKTRFTKPFQKVAVEVPYETGMDKYSGIIDVFVEIGVLTRSGAWYYIKGTDDKFQSKNLHKYVDQLLAEAEKLTNISLGSSISEDDELVEKDTSAQTKRIKNYMEFMDKNPEYVPEGTDKDLEEDA